MKFVSEAFLLNGKIGQVVLKPFDDGYHATFKRGQILEMKPYCMVFRIGDVNEREVPQVGRPVGRGPEVYIAFALK